jgi:hypothetical protein
MHLVLSVIFGHFSLIPMRDFVSIKEQCTEENVLSVNIHINTIEACPIRQTAILLIMSVSTFKTTGSLYTFFFGEFHKFLYSNISLLNILRY